MPATLDTAPCCFFCGQADRPLTEEHVWPKWVSRLLFGRYNSGHFRHLRSTGGSTTANWPSRYKPSTITAGHLAMQVMSVRAIDSEELVPASEIEFEFSGLARDAVIPIWPPVPWYVAWPPDHTMSHQDIEDLTSMWLAATDPSETPDPTSHLSDGLI